MKSLYLPLLLALLFSCTGKGPQTQKVSQIHEWRGENRSGIYHETNLLKEWPDGGPAEIWHLEGIGAGYGSPVVADDRLFVTGSVDSTAWLYCISLEGEILWTKELGMEWTGSYPGSRSAPTVVDDLVYAGTGKGDLYCVDYKSGKEVWRKNFAEDLGGSHGLFGHSESPAIEGNMVFWTVGGKEKNVVALDRYSGELLWSNPGHGEYPSYGSPRVITLPERKILITFSAYYLMGFDTESGEMLWSHEQDIIPLEMREPGSGDTHANTVLYENGAIYYAAGDGNCAVKLELSADGSEIREVWRNRGFNSYMGGIVKIGDTLYGSAAMKPYLKSIDVTTGRITDSLKIGPGAVIAADQMLYYYSRRGEMKLVSYDKGDIEEVSSFKITRGNKEHFSHPVINQGVLYIRHGDVLMAFDIA
ncbi:MAG: PQQ-binding-like beta-propeller repeat protein [Bacteroidota bacterium]